MAIGDYPAEYNPKVHGPYDPARYYGKREFTNLLNNICYITRRDQKYFLTMSSFLADTPFGQVKLSELGSWFARRNKGPSAFAGLFSRGKLLHI